MKRSLNCNVSDASQTDGGLAGSRRPASTRAGVRAGSRGGLQRTPCRLPSTASHLLAQTPPCTAAGELKPSEENESATSWLNRDTKRTPGVKRGKSLLRAIPHPSHEALPHTPPSPRLVSRGESRRPALRLLPGGMDDQQDTVERALICSEK